jgi:hypothetical protein
MNMVSYLPQALNLYGRIHFHAFDEGRRAFDMLTAGPLPLAASVGREGSDEDRHMDKTP